MISIIEYFQDIILFISKSKNLMLIMFEIFLGFRTISAIKDIWIKRGYIYIISHILIMILFYYSLIDLSYMIIIIIAYLISIGIHLDALKNIFFLRDIYLECKKLKQFYLENTFYCSVDYDIKLRQQLSKNLLYLIYKDEENRLLLIIFVRIVRKLFIVIALIPFVIYLFQSWHWAEYFKSILEEMGSPIISFIWIINMQILFVMIHLSLFVLFVALLFPYTFKSLYKYPIYKNSKIHNHEFVNGICRKCGISEYAIECFKNNSKNDLNYEKFLSLKKELTEKVDRIGGMIVIFMLLYFLGTLFIGVYLMYGKGGSAEALVNIEVTDPSLGKPIKIFLQSGSSLNGISIDSSNPVLSVSTEVNVSGTLQIEVQRPPSSPGNIVPVGYITSWGPHSSSYTLVASSTPGGTRYYSVPINLIAPSTPGTYYLIFSSRPEMNLGWVMSQTNWTMGSMSWNDGYDIADVTEPELLDSLSIGYLILDMLEGGLYKPTYYGIAYVKIIVE